MATTYSPDLRIALIADGDQANVWGDTTNTNLGTLIEQAIAGNVTVSVTSANQAFTVVNGATDQARMASIILTTTTGSAFAVYAPPVPKIYVIYNSTSYTATIYNSTVAGNTIAAGSGVALPAGAVLGVWSDGTNFYVQNNRIDTLNGVLGIAHGGTNSTTTPTAGTVAYGTGTAIGYTSVGTSGQVLTSTGSGTPAWATVSAFPSGTRMAFQQSSAPTGWTQDTTVTGDSLMRIINSGTAGSGGSTAFSTFNSQTVVGSTTLTSAQIPSHTHSVTDPGHNHTYTTYANQLPQTGSSTNCWYGTSTANTGTSFTGISIQNTGGGGSHNHSITTSIYYYDFIIAVKS